VERSFFYLCPGLVVVALSALVGCGHPGAQTPGDGGNVPPDGGNVPPDGGNPQRDGGNVPPDGGNSQVPRPMLRSSIGIDLSQVSAFAAVSGTSNASPSPHGGLSPMDGGDDGGVPPGPQLLALTQDGDVLVVILVEDGSPAGGGVVAQPRVEAIYPTPAWIFFGTPGFRVSTTRGGNSGAPIDCFTVAARRSDGALFCGGLSLVGGPLYGEPEPLARWIYASAAGDVVYVLTHDVLNQVIVYQITFDEVAGLTATLVGQSLHPRWALTNAAGDLLVNYFTNPLDPTTSVTKIYPVHGGAAFTLAGDYNSYAIGGEAGSADENSFYVLSDPDGRPGRVIRTVTSTGSSFTEADTTVSLDAGCRGLYQLVDGIYMTCGYGLDQQKSLARVIEHGAVVASPTLALLTGVDTVLDVRSAPGFIVLYASAGADHLFVRHDGVTRQNIPLDANISVLGVSVSADGDIGFMGVRADTNEKILGEVPAGATEVTILSVGGIVADQVVTFTQVN
jgi:hypothetical protein